MATLNDYFLKHGTAGFRTLAERSGAKLSYLLQLRYTTSKRPSIKLAERLIQASDGELTFEGLANPKKTLVKDHRKEEKTRAVG